MKPIIVYGFAIWLGATIALRVGGQHVFNPDSMLSIAILFVCSVPIMAWVPRAIFQGRGVAPENWARGAIALVVPGMLLDTFSTIFFSSVFPNIRHDAAALFAAWLLLCNATALISAAAGAKPRSPR